MYSWERVGVRVIGFAKSCSTFEITLTPTLSHEYVGEGTGGPGIIVAPVAFGGAFRGKDHP
jgi:hypothetical protein